jgi:spermidine/putrescine transport system substrate-binding protein/spermidine/putrescine transport system permease protein
MVSFLILNKYTYILFVPFIYSKRGGLMVKRMRKALAIGAGLFFVLGMSLWAGGQKDASAGDTGSKEVNMICWTEYVPQKTFDDFEAETGIKVNVTYYSSEDEMLAKTMSSAKDTYDVIMDGTQYYPALREKDLIDELDLSKVPNYKNIPDQFRLSKSDPDGKYGIPYMGANCALAWNSDVVKTPLSSYQDLLNPAFKDSIVIIDDARAVVGMAAMAEGYSINDMSDEALSAASGFLQKLKPNIHAFNGDSPKTLLINGECSVGLIYGAEVALAMDADPAVKGAYPKEGIYFGFDELSISKHGKNKENGYKLINFILDGKNSAYISTQFPYFNPNSDALQYLDESYLDNPIKNMPETARKSVEYMDDVGDNMTKIVDIFNKLKG